VFNPFTEVADDDFSDSVLVEQVIGGDRAALEKLILRHQPWVYNIAVRMVFRPHDAEEDGPYSVSLRDEQNRGPWSAVELPKQSGFIGDRTCTQ
jgi:hypothetical protein